ncbi:S1/P1 nuclease-domain-containing protein [Obelidium mucronatum]|nr:S1/P1 nuclease-domain-containing protein [Obelidium mucronatum]
MLTTVILAVSAVSTVNAWGSLGHSTTGEIAQRNLNENAKNLVAYLLMPEFKKSLSGATPNWADVWRKDHPETAPWHYINYPENDVPKTCGYTPNGCTGTGCVLSAITEQTNVLLKNNCALNTNTTLAVQYLTHFLGDITQPLHNCNRQTGGNDALLTYSGKKANFHGIHDYSIPEQYVKEVGINVTDHVAYATHLITKYGANKAVYASKKFVDLHTPRDQYLSAAVEMSIEGDLMLCDKSLFWTLYDKDPKQDFNGTYYQATKDVLNEQMTKAGYRMAAWFNAIADECAAVQPVDPVVTKCSKPAPVPTQYQVSPVAPTYKAPSTNLYSAASAVVGSVSVAALVALVF